ncbi:hypothetical protein [Streptomyces pseudovenezuelae]|uniref:hypothetical protein n=1 Tax=Streptomyces pseudovenezuelae TaxID=67350 RepID=UPI0036EFB17E
MVTVIHIYGWNDDTDGPGLAVHATASTAEASTVLADGAADFAASEWEGRRDNPEPQRWVSLELAPGGLWPVVIQPAAVLYVDERDPAQTATEHH